MKLYTIGKVFYEGARVPIVLYKDIDIEKMPAIEKGFCYRIVVINEGTGIVSIDDKKFIVHAPYIFILNEEEILQIEKQNDMKLSLLLFHPSILDKKFSFEYIKETSRRDVTDPEVQNLYQYNIFTLRDGSLMNYFKLTSIMHQRILSLFNSIARELEEQNSCYWICRSRSYLLELLCYLSREPADMEKDQEETLNFNADKMEDILLYVHTYYMKKITLNSIVEYFNINRTSINVMFKKYMGMSLISYLIGLRIEAASLMLRETGLPISEIAYRVGYEDLAHFNRSFKKLVGNTPGQYRKENCWLILP